MPAPVPLAHWMPWTGDPSRVSHDTGYRQDDPAVIEYQLKTMKAGGLAGVVAWWQGPNRTFTHDAFLKMFYATLEANLIFIPALDQWVAKGTANPTQSVINALTSPTFQGMLSFFPEKWVLEFDLALVGVDLAKVQAALPRAALLSKHKDYSWPEVTNTLAALKTDNASPAMKIPCVFSRFNDGGYPLPNGVGDPARYVGQRDYNRSVWGSGPVRIIEERAGQTWFDSLALVPPNSKYVALVTWNDYDEGTEHEPEFRRRMPLTLP